MVVVPDRGRDTLLEVIKEWIEPGTIIVSDFWKAYDCISGEGYQHLKVNHSITFKDWETGAHTNNIEASWRAEKAITTSAGRKKAHIPGNLAKYMFNKVCTAKNVDRIVEFFSIGRPAANVPIVPDNGDVSQEDLYGIEEEAQFDD